MRRYMKWGVIILTIVVIGLISSWIYEVKNTEDDMKVYFFDLKNDEKQVGESMLIMTPDKKTVLVDGGMDFVGDQVVSNLKELGIQKLNYVIGTHMHRDHIGGLINVIEEIEVEEILFSTFIEYDTKEVKKLFQTIEEKKIPYSKVKEGDQFKIGENVELQVLNPLEEIEPSVLDPREDNYFVNSTSIAFKLIYDQISMLFTGDITREEEQRLIEKYGSQLDVDLIKVPHHGDASSSSKEFVEMVSPSVSIINHNMFKEFDIYDRYINVGSKTYVTGVDGTIIVSSNGRTIEVSTEKVRKEGGYFKPQ